MQLPLQRSQKGLVPRGTRFELRAKFAFACFIRNAIACPLRLAVPVREIEGRLRPAENKRRQILARNRARFRQGSGEAPSPLSRKVRLTTGRFESGEQEFL